jgi:hypothetical protein
MKPEAEPPATRLLLAGDRGPVTLGALLGGHRQAVVHLSREPRDEAAEPSHGPIVLRDGTTVKGQPGPRFS